MAGLRNAQWHAAPHGVPAALKLGCATPITLRTTQCACGAEAGLRDAQSHSAPRSVPAALKLGCATPVTLRTTQCACGAEAGLRDAQRHSAPRSVPAALKLVARRHAQLSATEDFTQPAGAFQVAHLGKVFARGAGTQLGDQQAKAQIRAPRAHSHA